MCDAGKDGQEKPSPILKVHRDTEGTTTLPTESKTKESHNKLFNIKERIFFTMHF